MSILQRFSLCVVLGAGLATILRGERLPVRVYSTADGLPSTLVIDIVQDSRGFIWFCTRDGLSRFDGVEFVTFRQQDGLGANTVNNLLEARDGAYWVATNGGGVSVFKPDMESPGAGLKSSRTPSSPRARKIFDSHLISEDRLANRVNKLYQDSKGRLWVGTDGGLFRKQPGETPIRFEEIPLETDQLSDAYAIRDLVEDGDGNLWVASQSGVFRVQGNEAVEWYPGPSQGLDSARGLLLDESGSLWIAHEEGLFLLRPTSVAESSHDLPTTKRSLANAARATSRDLRQRRLKPGQAVRITTSNGLPSNFVEDLARGSQGRLWIATSEGLAQLQGYRLQRLSSAQGLPPGGIDALLEDRDENLWAASRNGQPFRLMINGLVSYTAEDGLHGQRVWSLHPGDQGEPVAVTDSSINRWREGRFEAVDLDLPDYQSQWAAQLVLREKTGKWLIAGNNGVYRGEVDSRGVLTGVRLFYPREAGDPANGREFRILYEDRQGDIWMGRTYVPRRTVVRWSRSEDRFYRYSGDDGLPEFAAPWCFYGDDQGTVWIGYLLGGLARYRQGRFDWFEPGGTLPADSIKALLQDQEGRLWIGTSGSGLAVSVDPQAEALSLQFWTSEDGLSSNNIRSLVEDHHGRIYIGTARGVDRLDPANSQIDHFGTQEGLADDFVNSAFQDREGMLWFGTMNGVSRLRPLAASMRPQSRVWIGALDIAGLPFPVNPMGQTGVTVPDLQYHQNHIEIDFFSLSSPASQRPTYQFRLIGAEDEGWSLPSRQQRIRFPNLAPGRYRFEVQAVSTRTDSSGPVAATVEFAILTPFWLRWWFQGGIAGLLLLGALLAVRARERRLLELERVRTQIASDLHDDLGSGLSRIAILSEVARQQMDRRRENPAGKLVEIGGLARSLLDSMSDIVWSIDPRLGDLQDLVRRIRQFSSGSLEPKEILWDFRAPDSSDVSLNPSQRRHLLLIFQEAITNAVRHSECRRVDLELAIHGKQLQGCIRDDGRGIESKAVEADSDGQGLRNMRRRVEEMGGHFRIRDRKPSGTEILFSIPL